MDDGKERLNPEKQPSCVNTELQWRGFVLLSSYQGPVAIPVHDLKTLCSSLVVSQCLLDIRPQCNTDPIELVRARRSASGSARGIGVGAKEKLMILSL